MSTQYTCDGCGRTQQGIWNGHKWDRPLVDSGKRGGGNFWWERQDEDGIQHACSHECIDKTDQKSGKRNWVFPW